MTRLPSKPRTEYFVGEGRAHMQMCLETTFEWCAKNHVSKAVIFTATGDGPLYAVKNLLPRPDLSGVRVIAVTPPFGRVYREDPRKKDSPLVRAGIQPAMKQLLSGFGVPVIAAQLPFKEVHGGQNEQRSSEWTKVSQALSILGGGFPLCVQAVLVACDAGEVEPGERVAALTADTSVIVLSSRTETFLSQREGLLIEHILCRPGRYDISKAEHEWLPRMWRTEIEPSPAGALTEGDHTALPDNDGDE